MLLNFEEIFRWLSIALRSLALLICETRRSFCRPTARSRRTSRAKNVVVLPRRKKQRRYRRAA